MVARLSEYVSFLPPLSFHAVCVKADRLPTTLCYFRGTQIFLVDLWFCAFAYLRRLVDDFFGEHEKDLS